MGQYLVPWSFCLSQRASSLCVPWGGVTIKGHVACLHCWACKFLSLLLLLTLMSMYVMCVCVCMIAERNVEEEKYLE